jgi:hypothetical protein
MPRSLGPAIDPEQISASYEDLRGLVLRGAGHGVGFAVFIRQGMAAWAAACAAATLKPKPLERPSASTTCASQLPDELRHELATLMAHMALSSHIQGAITA